MPEVVMKFNLPEEEHQMRAALNGSKYYSFLWDLDQQLRSWSKHGHSFKYAEDVIEEIRGALLEEINFDNN